MKEIQEFICTFGNLSTARQEPCWVEVWFNGEEVTTIDLNNRQTVREFARLADMQLRAGKDVRTIPV